MNSQKHPIENASRGMRLSEKFVFFLVPLAIVVAASFMYDSKSTSAAFQFIREHFDIEQHTVDHRPLIPISALQKSHSVRNQTDNEYKESNNGTKITTSNHSMEQQSIHNGSIPSHSNIKNQDAENPKDASQSLSNPDPEVTREEQNKDKKPLNIVLFYADDWTQKVFGKMNPHVQTPNIDKIADLGVMFPNNCVSTSICWISRATLMTGVYSARHLQVRPQEGNQVFTTHPWNETVFPLLRSQGNYHTGLVGKWHAPQTEPYMKMAWDYRNLYYGYHWMNRNGKPRHVTDLNREDSLHFLTTRPQDKPFALKVSFFATHALDGQYPSYQPMNESKRELYVNDTIPTPKTATDEHWKRLPHFFNENNVGRVRWRKRFEPDYYQDNIKDLYRMATEVDAAVGDIIEELKRQGVYDNTLIIFTTDNGNLHGEHGLAEKWYPFEESIRVPLVIQDPRMADNIRGTTNDALTLNVDLAPTILGAAGISASSFMQGRDMAALYLDQREAATASWRKDFFYEFNVGDPITAENHWFYGHIPASFALITSEWKYIYWPNYDYEQLFHRSIDQYDEWDLLNQSAPLHQSQIQTTDQIYLDMKERYKVMKEWAQSGKSV